MAIPPPPPGFTLDAPSAAPIGAPRPRQVIRKGAPPEKPPAPKTTYHALSPQEATKRGFPAGSYQESSEGKIEKIADAPKVEPITPAKLHEVRIDAANKINTIREIRRELHGMSFPNVSGAGLGDWLKVIPGTAARGLGAKLENLKAGGALAEVLKLSAATGRNPFTPMSNSDVDLISRNIGNLDQGQSADDLIHQLDLYEAAYGRGYLGAGGDKSRLLDRNRGDGPFPGKKAKAQPKAGVKFLGFE